MMRGKRFYWLTLLFGTYLVGIVARPALLDWDPSVAALFSPWSGFEYTRAFTDKGALGIRVGQTPQEILRILDHDYPEGVHLYTYKSVSAEDFRSDRSLVSSIDLATSKAQDYDDETLENALTAVHWEASLSSLSPDAHRNFWGYVTIGMDFEKGQLTKLVVSGFWFGL